MKLLKLILAAILKNEQRNKFALICCILTGIFDALFIAVPLPRLILIFALEALIITLLSRYYYGP